MRVRLNKLGGELLVFAAGHAKWYAKWYAISSRKKNIAYRMEYCLARAVGVLYMVRQIHARSTPQRCAEIFDTRKYRFPCEKTARENDSGLQSLALTLL